MKKPACIIDKIYWERIQLFIEGRLLGVEEKHKSFYLRNLTETKEVKANDVTFDGEHFKARFNIAILNDGDYLPEDQYLLIYKSNLDYIASINTQYLSLNKYDLDEHELEEYHSAETRNDQNNILLSQLGKTFKKNGTSQNTQYSILPAISREVNEFVFKVMYKQPILNSSTLKHKLLKLKLQYNHKSYQVRNFIFKSIFNIVKFFHLRKGHTVLFTSDSRAEMSGNFEFVYKEMLRQHLDDKYQIHQLFKPNIKDRRNFIEKFKLPYLLGKADYIFVDDFHPLLYRVKFRKSQEIIQLWHAVGAFKTVGFSRAGKKGGPMFDSPNHRNYTKAYVSSQTDIPFYGEAFGIKERNIIPTGVPRTDILFNEEYKIQITSQMEEELPQIKGKKVILFAPTFRGNGVKTAHYPFFKIDFKRLANYCKQNDAVVLFKMHPFVRNKLTIDRRYQNIFIDVSEYREVNDILFITDVLISDYSSLIYEYAVFEKPMLFYAFDLEDYTATRDFYEPYEKFVPGKIVTRFEDVITALEQNDFEQEKVPTFLRKHFKYRDGRSSERIVRDLFGS
ncbi:CDP-glycerol glycerophosphotransferase family protein [Staphylococcus pettenkoferi]|uniref:CDP-glycerol glycerophosphotransferase family protein n=1 Tax=Staphylococcus pettenkoferi TaxID=170573 RepID=UPI000B5199E2|nr:CDP-glycerol glycerophosphotransferase family protein [Staphylococcus pettenkoferi]ASE36946.1 CDP-glycerol--poly(glycerophosphate) glycerophosphotransferase [Staphylococcus pettenkoferi]